MRKKKECPLAEALPKGSWLDGHPELEARSNLGDLFIELDQLEADLTGILGIDARRLRVVRGSVEEQFSRVHGELEKASDPEGLEKVQDYLARLRSAYDRYLEQQLTD